VSDDLLGSPDGRSRTEPAEADGEDPGSETESDEVERRLMEERLVDASEQEEQECYDEQDEADHGGSL
jgi:hypothetical protein